MNDKKGWGSTVLGWFVVRDGENAADAAASDAPAEPDTTLPPPVEPVRELPAATGGTVDYEAVFEAFGIDRDARDRLEKAAELLRNLPAGTDAVVKRQIVEASLKAFGIPIERIIEAGCEELQALDAYQRKGGDGLSAFCADAESRIAALEQEIRGVREEMGTRVEQQKGVVSACNSRKLEVQQVLEFFGQEAVARVVRESPKLVDPTAAH